MAHFSARNDNIAKPDRYSSLIRCDESTAVSATATHLKLVTPPKMDLEWHQVPVTNFRNLFPLHQTCSLQAEYHTAQVLGSSVAAGTSL